MEDNMDMIIHETIIKTPKNIKEKLLAAKTLYTKLCTRKRLSSAALNNASKKVHFFTETNMSTIKSAILSAEKVKSFNDWVLIDTTILSTITFDTLRQIITSLYIKKQILVTANELLKALNELNYNFNQKCLWSILKHNGFTYKLLHGTMISIVVEKTEQFMHRMSYLNSVRHYREEGREFVYLFVGDIVIAVSSTLGVINFFWNTSTKDKIVLDTWIKCILLPMLPPNCVLITADANRTNPQIKPNWNSPKADICNWLKDNDIIHDPLSPRLDLLKLVKKFQKTYPEEKCDCEKMVNGYGHNMLYFPAILPTLNYFNKEVFLDAEQENQEPVLNILHTGTLEEWQNLEKELIGNENMIYEQDLKVENIIDQWLTRAKHSELHKEIYPTDDIFELHADYISSIILL